MEINLYQYELTFIKVKRTITMGVWGMGYRRWGRMDAR